ncbi:MAG: sigma-54 dependent transcriptional regulator [Candidatus Rokubacteria bacterium]|nr:sigma-54 dependent transcriptional regulator [Candidatus Rokubacteria bacterium]
MRAPRVLVVDNDPEMVTLLRRHLESEGLAVCTAGSGEAAIEAAQSQDLDVILTDLIMDDGGGMEVLAAAQRTRPGARVILMTAFGSLETAIEAMRQGAYDYLTKPFKLPEVTLAVRRALDDQRLRSENERLRAEVERQHGLDRVIARSRSMLAVLEQARAVADSDASVLLLGESGTGKELVARALHWTSSRGSGPFVAVNCAAVPEPLLESELFGHEKGAFTGADRKRPGLFAAAHGGTLFLDEVGDLPGTIQVKLLRAIQDKAVRPVGGAETLQLDLRLVTATNRDLATMVQDGRFREDLYYRLAVIPIRLPALRERPEDIPLLAEHFRERAAARLGKRVTAVSAAAAEWMRQHRWPGNVRELENVVERAVVLARGPEITRADLGTEFAVAPGVPSLRPTLDELEHQYIRRVLDEVHGDKSAAAKILGVSVRTLQRKAKEL